MTSFWGELKRRNVVRVAVAYVIIAWLILQVGDTLAPALRLTDRVNTVLAFFLILGFPMALFFAWAFELTPEGIKKEKDVDRSESVTHLTGRKLDYLIIGVLMVALGYFAYDKFVTNPTQKEVLTHTASRADQVTESSATDRAIAVLPLVVIMDSHHPSRVYDDDTVIAGGTNADVVSDILLDLPIRRQKEAVSPEWHRDEEILGFRPDLIIIHYSAFRQNYDAGPRSRLRLLIEYFADTDTQFLIYGRRDGAWLQEAMTELLSQLASDQPGLLGRVHVFGLLDHGGPSWRDPAIAASFKLFVKRILALA